MQYYILDTSAEKLQSKQVCSEIVENIRTLYGIATGTEKYVGRLLFMFSACSRVAGIFLPSCIFKINNFSRIYLDAISQQKAEAFNVDDDKIIENIVAKRRSSRRTSATAVSEENKDIKGESKEPPPSPRILAADSPDRTHQSLSPRYVNNI